MLAPCGSDGDGMAKSFGDAVEEVFSESAEGAGGGWDVAVSFVGIEYVDSGWLGGIVIVCADGDFCASTGFVFEIVDFCKGETFIVDWSGMIRDCGF